MNEHDDTDPGMTRGQARAEAKAAKARAKALRPWYRRPIFWVLAAVVAVVGMTLIAGTAADEAADVVAEAESEPGTRSLSANEENLPEADVVLTSCASDEYGYMKAEAEVTNRSSKASDYWLDVVFETPDGSRQVGSAPTYVSGLEPGQMATAEAGGYEQAEGEFVCRVASVNRTAAAG